MEAVASIERASDSLNDHGTAELFECPPRSLITRVPIRSSRFAFCPRCIGSGKRTGLVRQGKHLVWREHRYTTWAGTRMTCGSSGITICQLPPRAGSRQETCPCHDG